MRQPFRYAFCAALLCAFAGFAPSPSHAETGVNDQIAQAMDDDYAEMIQDVVGDKEALSRKVGDPKKWNPEDKRQAFVKKNMGLAINQKPAQDSQQHTQEVDQANEKEYDGFDPSIGAGAVTKAEYSTPGTAVSENATGENASCKIASISPAQPAQKTTILASPIAATLLALPVAAGSGPCPQKPKDKCLNNQWTKPAKKGKTADALQKSPINDSIQPLQGTKHVPEN